MNILFLAPRLPLPADSGGKIRTLNILKQKAQNNKVCLLCFDFDAPARQDIQTLEKLGIEVHLVQAPQPSLWQKVCWVLFNPRPFSIIKYDTPQMRRRIQEILARQNFDAIYIDHLHMAVYRDCFKDVPCFLDEHNVEYKVLERCALVEKKPHKRWLYRDQAQKMRRFEARLGRTFTSIFACSADDKAILEMILDKAVPIYVIPNGVDNEYYTAISLEPLEDAMVFTGSMDWLPNDDAITYFCVKILPLIWQKNASLRLYVVGKNPSATVSSLAARDKRVIITGRVEDVRPYIQRSKVFIVPLRIGGGTRLKILEAMAMGKAIVSTTIGAEGIECQPGLNIAIADTPLDFAQKVVELCGQPGQAKAMGKEGRDLIDQKYDWKIIGKKINDIYQKGMPCLRVQLDS